MIKYYLLGNKDTPPGITGVKHIDSKAIKIGFSNVMDFYQVREVKKSEYDSTLRDESKRFDPEAKEKMQSDNKNGLKSLKKTSISNNLAKIKGLDHQQAKTMICMMHDDMDEKDAEEIIKKIRL